YHLAADQGYDMAQRRLGDLYANGWNVERDVPAAFKWYGLAASQGDEESQRELAQLRKGCEPKPLPYLIPDQ
ncbi:MAG: tetratricopeptide repeat protein, partial [Pseudomonadales bacterium]